MENYLFLSAQDNEWCSKNRVNVTWPGRPDYPKTFLGQPYRPALLFYIGQAVWNNCHLLSVVGSRSPQLASLNWLDEHLSPVLQDRDLAIVSGGARGIDQKAHQIAIRCEKPTVAFIPSGLKNIYPENLTEWVKPIVDVGGCVVSQFLPSSLMQKRYFKERNELIAAISPITLIVECKRRSGTMLTAQAAQRFEKKLAVMPTFPGEAGMGGLDLIIDKQAQPVRDATDLGLALGDFTKLKKAKD